MTEQDVKIIATFLRRVDLKGGEVAAFNQAIKALEAMMVPAVTPEEPTPKKK